MFAPFLFEDVGSGEATVATDDHQGIDAELDQVASGSTAALLGPEFHASCRAEHRASLVQDATN